MATITQEGSCNPITEAMIDDDGWKIELHRWTMRTMLHASLHNSRSRMEHLLRDRVLGNLTRSDILLP